ncbi:gp53-like domain-containing protein [Aeromonas sp. QDB01]|uniref:gp53-like domain-containing protein n=1 Tax=Aeromonas sp. QDB01 TaxID=2990475 RepID=UPI0022E42D15|nr:hypothetical protein [Aeromonas sp. QDB01]
MHRIDTSSAQKDKFGAGKNGFTLGNAQTGVPPTEVSADILDALQEEICAVIEDNDSGLVLDKSKNNQLVTAIKNIIRSVGMLATETVRGVLKIATQTQTNAGSADDVAVTPKKLLSGFSISLGTNGYVAFPAWLKGLIIQWGYNSSGAAGAHTIPFPIAFPTACNSIYGIAQGGAPSNGNILVNKSTTTNVVGGFVSQTTAGVAASVSYVWLAIGN